MLRKHILSAIVLTFFIVGCTKDNGGSKRTTPITYNVKAITDVQYGQNTSFDGNNEKLLLDIYSPKNASAASKYPLVVMAHGGSFIDGDKDNLSTICQAIAEKGYIAVSIDYRVGWDYGNRLNPQACDGDTVSLRQAVYRGLQDYNASLRFLVHNASKYFIDTNWIFIGGTSAGAVAAVNTIYTTPDFVNTYYKNEKVTLGALRTADNSLTDAFSIKADINMWGAIINDSLITGATAVPMVAFHGSEDETVPFDVNHYTQCPNYPLLYGSQDMYKKLTALGVPTVLHIAQGVGHNPDIYQDPDFIATNVNCFLEGLIGKTPKTGTFNNLVSGCQ